MRGKDISIPTHSESLSHTQIPKIALPRYEADNGPLTAEQLAAIDKLVPQGRLRPTKRLF